MADSELCGLYMSPLKRLTEALFTAKNVRTDKPLDNEGITLDELKARCEEINQRAFDKGIGINPQTDFEKLVKDFNLKDEDNFYRMAGKNRKLDVVDFDKNNDGNYEELGWDKDIVPVEEYNK